MGDIIAMTADEAVFVVDAKASDGVFDANWPNLRPLVEYIRVQEQRQRGHVAVRGAAWSRGNSNRPTAGSLSSARSFSARHGRR